MFTILWRCTENIILLGVIVFEIFTPKYCLFAKANSFNELIVYWYR